MSAAALPDTRRANIALLAQQAGYGVKTLQLVAMAMVPRFSFGEVLDDPAALWEVEQGVRIFAQAGLEDEDLARAIVHAMLRGDPEHPNAWRSDLLERWMTVACARFAQPERFGLSPCEDDPERLAAWAPAAPSLTA